MNNYIFLTAEGYTYQPGSESVEPDIENLQVIGFSAGSDPDQAFQKLLEENPYIRGTTFRRLFSYKLDVAYEESLECHFLQVIE